MASSFLDSLEYVQTLDDNLNQEFAQPKIHQIEDKTKYLNDMEQNVNLKASCSTKPSKLMGSSMSHRSKQTFAKSSFCSRKSIDRESNDSQRSNSPEKNEIRKLSNNDKFSCQSCSHQLNLSCEICNGKSHLNGNDSIIKFFQYILEFKLGREQSYKPKDQKLLRKRSTPNEHCNIFYSTINPMVNVSEKPEPQIRYSINEEPSRHFQRIQHDKRLNELKEIHCGFGCDQCEADPIQGPRYHCSQCQNYDMCQQCFEKVGHCHNMQKVQIKNNIKSFDLINNILKTKNSSTIRSSIRHSSFLNNSMINNTCRSWIM